MNEGGRPTVMTPETLQKLEECFLEGLSDRESCLKVGIATQTLYNYCKENDDFAERKELLKEQIKLRAKQNIANEISKGDVEISKWYLERKDREFNPKNQTEIVGNLTINTIDEFGTKTSS